MRGVFTRNTSVSVGSGVNNDEATSCGSTPATVAVPTCCIECLLHSIPMVYVYV
jgi:hypothetical protein